jgi:drug/metabolite transporter (DMT)-like permease
MSELISVRLGEILSLTTAVTWAAAVILFKKSGERVHPLGLNQFKNLLAILLLIPSILIMSGSFFPAASSTDYLILLASGALGIGIADTLFFFSLNLLGAGRSSIVDCLYSPFIIGLSILWLGESMNIVQGTGGVLIISAVAAIAGEKDVQAIDRRHLLLGVLLGVLAMATMAAGIVMAKPVLDRHDVLWVTLTRLIGGAAIIFSFLLMHPNRRMIILSVLTASHRTYTFAGSFIGGYLSMILWLAGMKFTQASIAAALNQTSNIFIFIFAAWFLAERITLLRVCAISLGIIGAMMVALG